MILGCIYPLVFDFIKGAFLPRKNLLDQHSVSDTKAENGDRKAAELTSTNRATLVFNDAHPAAVVRHVLALHRCAEDEALTACARCAVIQAPSRAVSVLHVLVQTHLGSLCKYAQRKLQTVNETTHPCFRLQ